ncbi:hypothetical protein EHQ52_13420 [Leptospira koniambonensis]|uniref:Uncharacterized protein n=1 Tax=Leptospira koniambonensis TaxID=2484950 RepID=A0A4R9J9H3_9LEPT|nr:hypothetical protein [Leptospira koniambonensis]TGL35456.1 hypothetical protein EHQ52_13420 [Leptospira koniambonensis]
MSSRRPKTDILSPELLRQAAESARRKAFRKNLPIAIYENGVVVLLYKDGTKKFPEEVSKKISHK